MIAPLQRKPFIEGLNQTNKKDSKVPSWLNALRQKSFAQFAELGFPTVKDEDWKFTNIAPLLEHSFCLPTPALFKEQELLNKFIPTGEINIVFVNNTFSKELSSFKKRPKGLSIITLDTAIGLNDSRFEHLLNKSASRADTTFTALNKALTQNGVLIKVDDKTIIKDVINIIHVVSHSKSKIICAPRTLITMGKSSEATILENHLSFNDNLIYLATPLTEIFLSANAVLHYSKAQNESKSAFHIGNTRVWQERDSNFDGFSFMSGASLTRNNLDIALEEEGANANLNGLYSPFKNQLMDNHTCVEHLVPHCTSNQLYKGILNDSARAVFNGKIIVKPIAQKTNSYQLNKNLILGKNCRVDTKPQLEIFADDVKCTHGATIGNLNEDEIFYLCTRSIPRPTAIKMLSRGFMEDVLSHIQSESVSHKIHLLMEPALAVL